jgi:GrpB-like predicted nucleotidyltransferase (UPF0157 family)
MLGLDKNIVKLVPYDPEWVEEYKKEEAILKEVLGDYALDIQHVGSTSIPGISAKPILDIAVAVKDLATLSTLIPIFTEAGYDVMDSIESNGEILARKGTPDNRTHYIHVEVLGSEYWNNHILFRDYLLKHPEYIAKYEEIKNAAYNLYQGERKKYTAEKNNFIQDVLTKAKNEQ